MIPSNWENVQFEEFYQLMALADISREMAIEDMTIATNKAVVLALDGEDE